jgi:hypothetical protein
VAAYFLGVWAILLAFYMGYTGSKWLTTAAVSGLLTAFLTLYFAFQSNFIVGVLLVVGGFFAFPIVFIGGAVVGIIGWYLGRAAAPVARGGRRS